MVRLSNQLLTQGKRVRRRVWEQNKYWNVNEHYIVYNSNRTIVDAPFDGHRFNDWEIYEEPLTFSELKDGEKFKLVDKCHNTERTYTKIEGMKSAIYDGYKIMHMSDGFKVERVK